MSKTGKLWSVVAVLVVVALLAGSFAMVPAASAEAPKTKVAFVYVAPIGDMGWTYAHDLGRKMLEEELGVETAYIENVPEGPDAERVIRDYAQKGYNVIFTTSFGYMDPTITVAEEFPDMYFEHCSGYKTAPNSATYFGRMYQPRFLSGLVAGAATETNKIGYVAAFPIPEVIRGINAFTLGVRAANPEATVHVVWTNTWFGPPQEKEAAEALLAEGCDVIAQHQDTTEPQKAAQEKGLVSIGYDSDMGAIVGDSVLTSPMWDWGPYYVRRVQEAMDGTWETGQHWGSMADGIVKLADFSPKVPDDVKAQVKEYEDKILSGEWDVFTGPINGQGGKLAVPDGVALTDPQMLSLDWFVEGVVGEAPAEPPTVKLVEAAFVLVGPAQDGGWSQAHDNGRKAMEETLGIETAVSELVAEGPDANRVLRDFAEKGYDLIFATSFGYMDDVLEIAAEYPDVIFEHCTGYKTADNVSIYDGRGYQGWYLSGLVAGNMTESNQLGYIAPYPIPEVIRNMNAFALGARSVNPDAEVTPVWINAWVDPPKEREAAQALFDEGADVVARESDSNEPDKLAEELGKYVVGYNLDNSAIAPNAWLTAPIWDWGVFYVKAGEDVMTDKWTNTPVWWGMQEGLLKLAPFGDKVPADVQKMVRAKQQEIVEGVFDIFAGPINDNTGEERVAAGESMSDEEKLSFNWLIEGVNGTIPE